MENKTAQILPRDLGVTLINKSVYLYSNIYGRDREMFRIGVSNDGLSFRPHPQTPVLLNEEGIPLSTFFCQDFRITPLDNSYFMTYKFRVDDFNYMFSAKSKDGIVWKRTGQLADFDGVSMLLPGKYDQKYLMITGESDLKIAISDDLKTWKIENSPLLTPRNGFFDNYPLQLGSVLETEQGLLLLYFVRTPRRETNHFKIGAALLDKENPKQILWRRQTALWEQPEEWNSKHIYPLGVVRETGHVIFYFGSKGDGVYAVSFNSISDILDSYAQKPKSQLQKFSQNPIIRPVLTHSWEASATFNPAALYEAGKVHFVYRAMGQESTSVLGYATSTDGFTIDERLDMPIYTPTEPFEYPGKHPSICFMSGGGYGGCEDPRLTKIGDTIYMTYVAYNGRDAPKVALTSIPAEDFLERNWTWKKPKIISRPDAVDKNCVLFPEKINGKYVVMHRIYPDILIDFVDSLDFENGEYLRGEYHISPRIDCWDSRKLGAGAPPIKTKYGWLLIYQAVDDRDPGQYKIGAMLLDLKDPTRVLYRSIQPILKPSEWYENEGFKAGVAYPCGAVVINNQLIVYYGGADTVICVASENLDTFLTELKSSSPIKLRKIPSPRRVSHAYDYA